LEPRITSTGWPAACSEQQSDAKSVKLRQGAEGSTYGLFSLRPPTTLDPPRRVAAVRALRPGLTLRAWTPGGDHGWLPNIALRRARGCDRHGAAGGANA